MRLLLLAEVWVSWGQVADPDEHNKAPLANW